MATVPLYVKLTLLSLSMVSLLITRLLPGTRNWWAVVKKKKIDAFLFLLLFISVMFLGGVRSENALIDPTRAARIGVILLVLALSWYRILTVPRSSSVVPLSLKFMVVFALAAGATGLYSLHATLTVWKALETFAHVSVAIALAKNVETLEDAQGVINLIWLALLYLVISTMLGALLFPGLAYKQFQHFQGLSTLYPSLNLNTGSQVGASMGIGAIALALNSRTKSAVLVMLLIAAAGISMLVLARSRTSLFALVACLLVFAFYGRSAAIKVVTIAGTLVIAVAWTAVRSYIYRAQTQVQFESMTGRVQFWEMVIEEVMKSPIIGYGYYSGARMIFNVPGADNAYLTVLLGGGVLLCVVFIIPVLVGTYQLYLSRPSKSLHRGTELYKSLWMQVAGLFTILIMRSVTGPSFDAHHIALTMFVFVLIGAGTLYRYRNRGSVCSRQNSDKMRLGRMQRVNRQGGLLSKR